MLIATDNGFTGFEQWLSFCKDTTMKKYFNVS